MLLLPTMGNANIVSPKPDKVGVTIYRASEEGNPDLANPEAEAEGIALISELRELDLPAGESVIDFVGVAGTIVPESARLDSVPGVIVETNFDYKLISPGELIANSIGQLVQLVRTDEHTGKITEQRGRLVSGPNGVVLDIDGKIEALDCSGAHEKLVFDSLPEGLRSKPVLSAKVRVNKAGHHLVRLSYLAMGFDWSANYVAHIQPDGRSLNLDGWVTLANKQDTSFLSATVQVIAGNVSRDESTKAVEVPVVAHLARCWPIGAWNWNWVHATKLDMPLAGMLATAAPLQRVQGVDKYADALEEVVITKQRDLGDYKLYELPFKSDLSSQQVKQVMMTHNVNVPFEKIYTLTLRSDSMESGDDNPTIPAQVLLRMQNKEERGLGKALPAGNVVVMEPDGEQLMVVGMNKIKDVAVGLPVDVDVGSAFDVLVVPKLVREYQNTIKKIDYEYAEMEVTLVNTHSEAVKFELRIDTARGEMSIVRESAKHIMHKGLPTWPISIPGRSQKAVKFTVRHAN